jgi:probable rRNA maturation factor
VGWISRAPPEGASEFVHLDPGIRRDERNSMWSGDGPMIEVEVEDPAWTGSLAEAEALARRSAEAALAGARVEGDVAVLLTSDEEIADLNGHFRGKAGPTNVLSFPAAESARPHLGDVAVAHGVCAREALEQGKRLEHHLMHLVAHGVLHLVGYDHETEVEAEAMEALERQVMAGLGAPDPYRPADAVPTHDR